jgi:hypothetical protein
MQILYDFEITFPNWKIEDNVQKLFGRLKDFVRQRVRVLEDKINADNGIVLINVFGTMQNINPTIQPGINYNGSPELEDNVLSCFSHQDLIFIANELEKLAALK